MNLKTLLFADLDDTLFQSSRKRTPEPAWPVAAHLKNGDAICYQSPRQQALFEHFASIATVIPVTARNHDAFSRVRLRFQAEAILNYGGVLLESDGSVNEEWMRRSRQDAAASRPLLEHWSALLRGCIDRLHLDIDVRIITDFETPYYVVAKSRSSDAQAISLLAMAFREHGGKDAQPGCVHVNDNNLALLPAWLDKGHAVDYLLARYKHEYGEVLTIGIGDSLIDLGFMRRCDYLITPAGSQIAAGRLSEA